MTDPAHALLATLRRDGVVLEARGSRLRVDTPKGIVTPEIRGALSALKPDILSALAREARFLETSFSAFESSDDVIELQVRWLDESLWLVPRAECIQTLVDQGVHRGRIWTAREMADLISFPEVTREDIARIGRLKVEFGAELVLYEDTRVGSGLSPGEFAAEESP